jgi:serine/threonine protein kinase
VAINTASQPVDNQIVEFQDAISHLTLFEYQSFDPVPKLTTKGSESLGYISKFERYCIENEVYDLWASFYVPFKTFISNTPLEPCSEDPEGYLGIQHAASLLQRDSEAEDVDNLGLLSAREEEMLMSVLDCRYASDLAIDQFVAGKKIDNGKADKAWVIISQLYNVSGSYNRGVHLVLDADHPNKPRYIMKTLPSPAYYSGFAERKIEILRTLEHDNIVRFFDGGVPKDRHETGWMVTEYCGKGTLKDLLNKYIEVKTSIPERFVWSILESLVRAAVYLHYGPHLLDQFDQQRPRSRPLEPEEDPSWDSVYHHDIILSNVFYTSSTRDMYNYPKVKLGDFRCAMRQSEVETKDEDEYPWADETPIMDGDYEPPEGQYATKAVDIYQVGLLMWCIVQNVSSPSSFDEKAMRPEGFGTPSSSHYSQELRHALYRCTKKEPDIRIDSLRLLHRVRRCRKQLIFEDRLPFVELLP